MSATKAIERLDELLEPAGFVRRKMAWNRRVPSGVDVIDVQVSKTLDTATINAGAMDPEIYSLVWEKPVDDFVRQPDCTVGVRVGELIDGLDKWWELKDPAAPAQMAEAVQAHVLPFLDRMHTREGMEQWLVEKRVARKRFPLPIIHLALLQHRLGKAGEACALLAEMEKKPIGAWGERVSALRLQLGCA